MVLFKNDPNSCCTTGEGLMLRYNTSSNVLLCYLFFCPGT